MKVSTLSGTMRLGRPGSPRTSALGLDRLPKIHTGAQDAVSAKITVFKVGSIDACLLAVSLGKVDTDSSGYIGSAEVSSTDEATIFL